MYCHDCGKENKDESKFCAGCGASLNRSNFENTEPDVGLPPTPAIFEGNYAPKRLASKQPKKGRIGIIIVTIIVLLVAAAVVIGNHFGFGLNEIKNVFEKRVLEKSSASELSTSLPAHVLSSMSQASAEAEKASGSSGSAPSNAATTLPSTTTKPQTTSSPSTTSKASKTTTKASKATTTKAAEKTSAGKSGAKN